MKRLSTLNWITLVAGVAIIVICFFMLGDGLARDIFWLDMIVSVIVYCLLFFRTVRPMIDLNDETGRDVGSLGLNWTSVLLYSIIAIVLMIVLQLNEVEFKYQILSQVILAFLLLIAQLVSSGISSKTAEVYHAEKKLKSGLERLRREIRSLERSAMTTPGLPAQIHQQISDINSQLRYLSPSDNPEATELEEEMSDQILRIKSLCSDYEVNAEMIAGSFDMVRQLLKERKSIYSR